MNNDTSFDITKESNPVQTVAPTNKEDNEMLRATEKITALYCRLSVEDTKDEKKNGKEDLSNSIQHQQVMLMQYAKANRLPNPTYFIDDGYSGVTPTPFGTSAADTIFVPSFWKMWSGNT